MANYSANSIDFDSFSEENKKTTSVFGGTAISKSENHFESIIGLVSFSSSGGASFGSVGIVFGGGATANLYLQRIFDITLNTYVYYKLVNKTSSPAPTQTTPNNSGNLLVSSHEVISIITETI